MDGVNFPPLLFLVPNRTAGPNPAPYRISVSHSRPFRFLPLRLSTSGTTPTDASSVDALSLSVLQMDGWMGVVDLLST